MIFRSQKFLIRKRPFFRSTELFDASDLRRRLNVVSSNAVYSTVASLTSLLVTLTGAMPLSLNDHFAISDRQFSPPGIIIIVSTAMQLFKIVKRMANANTGISSLYSLHVYLGSDYSTIVTAQW